MSTEAEIKGAFLEMENATGVKWSNFEIQNLSDEPKDEKTTVLDLALDSWIVKLKSSQHLDLNYLNKISILKSKRDVKFNEKKAEFASIQLLNLNGINYEDMPEEIISMLPVYFSDVTGFKAERFGSFEPKKVERNRNRIDKYKLFNKLAVDFSFTETFWKFSTLVIFFSLCVIGVFFAGQDFSNNKKNLLVASDLPTEIHLLIPTPKSQETAKKAEGIQLDRVKP